MSTNISLTPELEQYAKGQVASGLYGSVSEFMRDAVRMHRRRNLENSLYIQALHEELAVASSEIDSGDISPLNMQDITKQAFQELDSENA
jgi:putative addiction module CopG family antidote